MGYIASNAPVSVAKYPSSKRLPADELLNSRDSL